MHLDILKSAGSSAKADSTRLEVHLASALSVVLGPSSSAAGIAQIEKMGGGWAFGVQAWRDANVPYVLLLAANKERLDARAPAAVLVRNLDALKLAAEWACTQLIGVHCVWVSLVDGDALALVNRVTLADTQVGGHA
jgi:hypothetical protein